jgi:hypothetical protein
VNSTQLKRLGAAVVAASLALTVFAGPASAAPPGGTSRNITVSGTSPIFDGEISMSAGEQISFKLTVANAGPQTVNNISLLFGLDDDPDPQANGDATPPRGFGAGIALTESSTSCTGGSILTCAIGTLGARKSFSVDVTLATAGEEGTAFGPMLVEAVASVSEAGGDSGYNIDTFTDQGDITVVEFSCESVTAYRGGSNKTVSTCDVLDERNGNGQSASVTLPPGLTTMVLSENPGAACPPIDTLTCIGDEVEADITDDTTDDTIVWTIEKNLDGASVNLNKLVIVHTNDDGEARPISLSKSNACKGKNTINCGSASISDGVLTVTVKTPGNGKTRLLG